MIKNMMYLIYLTYALTLSTVLCDIQRFEDGTFIADFIVINKGQMQYPSIVMILEGLTLNECTEYCIKHLDCVTFNYNCYTRACELVDQDFDEFEALDDDPNWYNYGTPEKIDGGWTNWTSSPCDVTCGNGTITQYRTCSNPEAKYGGAPCIGNDVQSVSCEMEPCPTCTMTVSGECCVFPFYLFGKSHEQCVLFHAKYYCVLETGPTATAAMFECVKPPI